MLPFFGGCYACLWPPARVIEIREEPTASSLTMMSASTTSGLYMSEGLEMLYILHIRAMFSDGLYRVH